MADKQIIQKLMEFLGGTTEGQEINIFNHRFPDDDHVLEIAKNIAPNVLEMYGPLEPAYFANLCLEYGQALIDARNKQKELERLSTPAVT